MLGAAGLGMKGRDESMGPGRGVRPGGPTLPRGTWVSGQVVSSAEGILGPAAPEDAASSHGQAVFLSYTTVGGKGEKGSSYQQKGRNHHLSFTVLSSESHSIPQYPDLQTCNDAAYLPHWSAANLNSLAFVAYIKTLN